jgi:hypothetical protein
METFLFLFSMLHERVFQNSRSVEQTNVTHTHTHTHTNTHAHARSLARLHKCERSNLKRFVQRACKLETVYFKYSVNSVSEFVNCC